MVIKAEEAVVEGEEEEVQVEGGDERGAEGKGEGGNGRALVMMPMMPRLQLHELCLPLRKNQPRQLQEEEEQQQQQKL